jgi:hypothetical protein
MCHVWRARVEEKTKACRLLVGKPERDQFEDMGVYARIVES